MARVRSKEDEFDLTGESRDAILVGDDQGYVNLLTIDMADLTGPKPTSVAGLSASQRRTGKVSVNLDPNTLTV